MRVKFSYILFILLVAFLLLYLIDPFLFSRSFKDLWANLLAGVIAALLIDRIVKYSEKEKLGSSIKYIKKRLSRVCTSLVSGLAPAMEWTDFHVFDMKWKNAIQSKYDKEDWKAYFERVTESRKNALKDVEYIVNNQRDLLGSIQNDVFDLKEALEDPGWKICLRMTMKEFGNYIMFQF